MEFENKIKSFIKAFNYAEKNNGTLLTEEKEYKSNKKCLWKCNNNHEWFSTFGNLYHFNRWCPDCSGNKKYGIEKYTIEDCKQYAKTKNGKCLSEEYKNTHEYLIWQCENNHVWKAKFYLIKNLNNWCRKCSGHQKKTIEDCKQYAETKNGKCLSEEYKDNKTKLIWQCENGHVWEAKFNTVKSKNSWCPECRLWKNQNLLFEILCNVFGKENCFLNYRGFKWLKNFNTNYPLEIDIFVKNYKIAIEYHGQQHYFPVKYFGGEKTYKTIIERDNIKKDLIYKNVQDIKYFIIFSYNEKITETYVRHKLKNEGVLL